MRWFRSRLNETVAEVNDLMGKFRINEALMAVYRLFWDEFSSWYLEMVKPAYGKPIDSETLRATRSYFDALLRMLHPFMPFITEELWQHLTASRAEGESIMYAKMPEGGTVDAELTAMVEQAKEIISGVRAVRAKKNIPARDALTLNVLGQLPADTTPLVCKLAGIDTVNNDAVKDAAAASFMVGTLELNVPLASAIDVPAEIARLEKDIKYLEGFKASIEKKLANERFVAGAPAAVVENERKKLADTLSKLEANRATLAALKA